MYSLVCFTDPFMQLEFAIFGRDELKAHEYEKKPLCIVLHISASNGTHFKFLISPNIVFKMVVSKKLYEPGHALNESNGSLVWMRS